MAPPKPIPQQNATGVGPATSFLLPVPEEHLPARPSFPNNQTLPLGANYQGGMLSNAGVVNNFDAGVVNNFDARGSHTHFHNHFSGCPPTEHPVTPPQFYSTPMNGSPSMNYSLSQQPSPVASPPTRHPDPLYVPAFFGARRQFGPQAPGAAKLVTEVRAGAELPVSDAMVDST